MTLTIKLSKELPAHYAPGDVICGVVQFHARALEEPLVTISISFTGFSTVHFTRNNTDMISSISVHKTSSASFFRRHLELATNENLHGPGSYAWPFVFKIPTCVEHSKDLDDAWQGTIFDSSSPLRFTTEVACRNLPPSFQFRSNFKATVEYLLNVRLIHALHLPLQGTRNLERTLQMTIRPRQTCSAALESYEDLSEEYMCALRRPHRRAFEAVKRHVCPARTIYESQRQSCCEKIKVNLKVSLPKTIGPTTGGTSSPVLQVSCSGCEHATLIQTAHIQVFKLNLIATTKVRAGAHCDSQKQTHRLCNTSLVLPVSMCNQQDNDPVCDTLDSLHKLLQVSIAGMKLVPEFATFNVFRAYVLGLFIRLKVAGRTLTFQRSNIPVQVTDCAETGSAPPQNSGSDVTDPVYMTTDIFLDQAYDQPPPPGIDDLVEPPPVYAP
jgi:hypothetical protein